MLNKKRNNKKIKSFQIIILSIVVALIAMFAFFSFYFNRVYDVMLEKDMEQVEWTSHFVTKLIHEEIKHSVSSLYASEEFFAYSEEYGVEKITMGLNEMKEQLDFERTGVMDLEGNTIDDSGVVEKSENEELLNRIKEDESYLSNVMEKSDNMLLAVPLHRDGNIVGAIWGYYAVSTIAEKIELTDQLHRYFQIVDDNGTYISKSGNIYSFAEEMNLWNELKRYQFSEGVTIEQIQKNVAEGKKGFFYFTFNGEGRYVTYEPLGINNWYVFSVMVEDFLGDSVRKVERIFTRLLIGLAICVGIVMCIIGTFIYRAMKMIKEQNQKLQVNNSLISMILKKTNDIPFEVNLQKKELYLYYNDFGEEDMEYEVIQDISPTEFLKRGVIKEEGYESYLNLYKSTFSGKQAKPVIIEMNLRGAWNWCRVHTILLNKDYAVGFLEDYNTLIYQDNQIKEIKKKNQRDQLTDLYTREYFVQQVEEILKQRKQVPNADLAALFLLDLDSFKVVNDTLGHIVGDQVLHETGSILKAVTRETDLAGRLGGDEFVFFIHHVSDEEGIRRCAEKINAALVMNYYDDENTVTVTASIGIAMVREESTFTELYERADRALYQVKKSKKNGYKILK